MGHRTPGRWSTVAALFHGASPRRRERLLALEPVSGDVTGNAASCHGRHHPREPVAVVYLFLLFSLWVVNGIDLALTLHWTGDVGWTAEGNRIMRAIAHAGGTWGFVLYKVLLMTLVVLVLWWLYLRVEDHVHHARHRPHQARARMGFATVIAATVALMGFYVWVIANNLAVMGYV